MSATAAPSAGGTLPPIVSPDLIPTAKTRLPKLELQKFKGNVRQVSGTPAVHDKLDISKVDKFNYLCSSKVVQGLKTIMMQRWHFCRRDLVISRPSSQPTWMN